MLETEPDYLQNKSQSLFFIFSPSVHICSGFSTSKPQLLPHASVVTLISGSSGGRDLRDAAEAGATHGSPARLALALGCRFECAGVRHKALCPSGQGYGLQNNGPSAKARVPWVSLLACSCLAVTAAGRPSRVRRDARQRRRQAFSSHA